MPLAPSMDRRTLLGTAAAAAVAALAGCGGDGEDTPQGTLIGGTRGGDGGGGDGGVATSTPPPTTGARDVFEGVDFDVGAADGGGTRTSWTVENVSEDRWSVTLVSILEVEPGTPTEPTTGTPTDREATPTVRVDERARRITLGPGQRTAEQFTHDVAPTAWSSFRFEFRDLQRA